MKKLSLLAVSLLVVVTGGVQAQNQSDEMTQRLDSLQQVVNNMSNTNQELEQERLNRVVWKDRAKYFNLGYVKQTLTDKSTGIELQSDFGVSLSSGKTYYLHKKPLAGMIKFGLDWTWMDLNYAKSTLPELDPETGSVDESAVHQAEFSMQFGPSVTINPVHRLKVSGYFRVAPSYSALYMNDTFHHHYVTMWNAGCAVAWNVISVGVEWRWGSANYSGLSFDESNFDEDAFGDEENPSVGDIMDEMSVPKRKFKTSSMRIYLSFRF